jgi:hypothetical protein
LRSSSHVAIKVLRVATGVSHFLLFSGIAEYGNRRLMSALATLIQ